MSKNFCFIVVLALTFPLSAGKPVFDDEGEDKHNPQPRHAMAGGESYPLGLRGWVSGIRYELSQAIHRVALHNSADLYREVKRSLAQGIPSLAASTNDTPRPLQTHHWRSLYRYFERTEGKDSTHAAIIAAVYPQFLEGRPS